MQCVTAKVHLLNFPELIYINTHELVELYGFTAGKAYLKRIIMMHLSAHTRFRPAHERLYTPGETSKMIPGENNGNQ